jgi:hypothetical protein
MEKFNHKTFTAKLIQLYGSVLHASQALEISRFSLTPKKFQRLTAATREKILKAVELAEHSVERSNRVAQTSDKTDAVVQPIQIPAYDPGQEGITFASKMIRLTAEILLSFSMIPDAEKRRAIRAMLDHDLALLLHVINVHAADFPKEVAQLLKNDELLAQLGLTADKPTTPKTRKGRNS